MNTKAKKLPTPKSGPSTSSFSVELCESWFHDYAGGNKDTMEPEGVKRFCKDIGVEPEDIVMLVIAYKMEAKRMGFFTLSEWKTGMSTLQCDCISKLRDEIDNLRSSLNDKSVFRQIYRYAYNFTMRRTFCEYHRMVGKTDAGISDISGSDLVPVVLDKQGGLEKDISMAMISLLLGEQWSLCGQFLQFLEQSNVTVVKKDHWNMVLDFADKIRSNLSNYDENGAWPVLFDEFVEWYRQQYPTSNQPADVSSPEELGVGSSLVDIMHETNISSLS